MSTAPESGRLFVAWAPSCELRELMLEMRRELSARLGAGQRMWRWVEPDDAHVTLAFLGDVPLARVAEISAHLEVVMTKTPAIAVQTSGVSAFGGVRTRALVLTLVDPEARLPACAASLVSELGALGLALEERPYRAHLTLARPRRPVDGRRLERLWTDPRAAGMLEEAVLFESTGNSAARYRVLHRARARA